MLQSIAKAKPEYIHEQNIQGNNTHILDVRTSKEFKSGHARGALSLPMDRLNALQVKNLLGDKAGFGEPVYLMCTAGIRAQKAANRLKAQGLNNLVVVEGGMQAWEKSGLPVHQPRKSKAVFLFSPQAQVEFFIGALVLFFAAKAVFFHPLFMGIVALAGITLMLSGSSERFNLVKLFARLPWNRVSPS